jgi:hypothetical protein
MKIYLLDPSAATQFNKNTYEYRTVGIFLRNSAKEKEPRLFRCINCSRVIFEYAADDLLFIMDDTPLVETETALDIKCHCCKINYKVMC